MKDIASKLIDAFSVFTKRNRVEWVCSDHVRFYIISNNEVEYDLLKNTRGFKVKSLYGELIDEITHEKTKIIVQLDRESALYFDVTKRDKYEENQNNELENLACEEE